MLICICPLCIKTGVMLIMNSLLCYQSVFKNIDIELTKQPLETWCSKNFPRLLIDYLGLIIEED